MQIRLEQSIAEIGPDSWDAISHPSFPFSDYSYLHALEESGSVGADTGWEPLYLCAMEEDALLGAMFLYIKTDSYGEYIFDWAWAEAFERYGIPYYPKLVSAVPYTPATGPKILCRNRERAEEIREILLRAALQITREYELSSFHVLFIPDGEQALYRNSGMMIRSSMQFHWHNRDYSDFEDFLAALKVKKRHEIRRERKAVDALPVEIHELRGDDLTEEHARTMYGFYVMTYDRKWGQPYLTRDFFSEVFETMRDQVVLWMAREGSEWVAGALHFLKGAVLYGRHWGCSCHYRYLHFELCYYRAIEYAIRHGLRRVEAGAQGPNKLLKGYVPVTTYSAHWISDPEFGSAIGKYILEESDHLRAVMKEGEDRSAFKPSPPCDS
jgi:hypothetical protein